MQAQAAGTRMTRQLAASCTHSALRFCPGSLHQRSFSNVPELLQRLNCMSPPYHSSIVW